MKAGRAGIFDLGFERLPGLYQFYLAVAVFVLIAKAAYFMGFFFGLMGRDCPPVTNQTLSSLG